MFTSDLHFPATFQRSCWAYWGGNHVRTESDHRYYSRRAAEERLAARRSVTDAARERHEMLAAEFAERAYQYQPIGARA